LEHVAKFVVTAIGLGISVIGIINIGLKSGRWWS
jgi:hypothetical protein